MNNETMAMTVTDREAPAAARGASASVEVAQAREMAEVQSMVIMARRFPRDEVRATDRIRNACQRESLAESAVYQYARGGTDVTGPSIRLAEALAQNWGNIQCGVRELEQRNGESTCEAYAWDLETNTRVAKVFHVAHIRHTKRGDTLLTDPRDIYEMVANNGSRRMRSCILSVIPGDIVEMAVSQCEQTLNSQADNSLGNIERLLKAFEALGVSRQQIEARIQRRADAITKAQVVQLRKIYASVKDGMSHADDWFDALPDAAASGKDDDRQPSGKKSEKAKVKDAMGLGQPDVKPAAGAGQQDAPPSPDPLPY